MRALRKARDFKGAVAKKHDTELFPGVRELLEGIATRGIAVAVVTTSVSYYASAILKHHAIDYDALIAYHDARPKPAPDGVLLG